MAAKPATAGIGILPRLDPFADETLIRELYGAGRYLLTARNSKGDQIHQRAITLSGGLSKPLESSEDVDESGIPMMLPSSHSPELALLIKSMSEESRRQRDADQTRYAEQMARLEKQIEMQVGFVREMASQKDNDRAQSHALQIAQMQEHQRALAEIYTKNQVKPPSFMEEMEKFKLMKEMMGGDEDKEKSALVTAIEQLPNIIGPVASMFGGGFEEDEDEETEPEVRKSLPAAPSKPQEPRKAKPIKEVAIDLFASLVAAGVPKEKAEKLVQQGMNMLASQVKDDLAKAKQKVEPVKPKSVSPIVAKAEAPAVTAAPAPTPTNGAKPAIVGDMPLIDPEAKLPIQTVVS